MMVSPMTRANAIVLLIAIIALAGMTGVEDWQVDRARRVAASWEKLAREQAGQIEKAKTALQLYDLALGRYRAQMLDAADDAAVCASMLPAEQRKSFAGHQ